MSLEGIQEKYSRILKMHVSFGVEAFQLLFSIVL
jgi:hypothetical protein